MLARQRSISDIHSGQGIVLCEKNHLCLHHDIDLLCKVVQRDCSRFGAHNYILFVYFALDLLVLNRQKLFVLFYILMGDFCSVVTFATYFWYL